MVKTFRLVGLKVAIAITLLNRRYSKIAIADSGVMEKSRFCSSVITSPVAPSGTDQASAAGTCQKRHPIGLMEADGPSVHRHTQK
jgi:hypothetical protein